MTTRPKIQSFISPQELRQNYQLTFKILQQDYSNKPITYDQLLYLLLSCRVQLSQIAYFRNKKYHRVHVSESKQNNKARKQIDEMPSVHQKRRVIDDAMELGKQVINNEWRWRSIKASSFKNIHLKEEIGETRQLSSDKNIANDANTLETIQKAEQAQIKSITPLINSNHLNMTSNPKIQKQQRKSLIKNLQEQLTFLQAKINSCRHESQIIQTQDQYSRIYKKLTNIRNQRRLKYQQRLKTQAIREITEIPDYMPIFLKQIYGKIVEIKREDKKILNKEVNVRQVSMSKMEELSRLKQIFYFYTKQQMSNKNHYFSDLSKSFSKLYIETFMKFIKDWSLQRILSADKISKIFKKVAANKGLKFIEETDFNEVLAEIHQQECLKEDIQFTSASLATYLQKHIVCDQKMMKLINKRVEGTNKRFASLDEGHPDRSIKSKAYKYQMQAHSGKLASQIREQIQEKKKNLQHLSGLKNVMKFKQRKRMNTLEGNLPKNKISASSYGIDSKVSSIYSKYRFLHNDTIKKEGETDSNNMQNSYASRFRNRKQNVLRTEKLRDQMVKELQIIESQLRKQKQMKGRSKSRGQEQSYDFQTVPDSPNRIQIKPYFSKNLTNPDTHSHTTKLRQKNMSQGTQLHKRRIETLPAQLQDLRQILQSSDDEYLNNHLLPIIKSSNNSPLIKKKFHY